MAYQIKADDGTGTGWRWLGSNGEWHDNQAEAKLFADEPLVKQIRNRLKRTMFSVKIVDTRRKGK